MHGFQHVITSFLEIFVGSGGAEHNYPFSLVVQEGISSLSTPWILEKGGVWSKFLGATPPPLALLYNHLFFAYC